MHDAPVCSTNESLRCREILKEGTLCLLQSRYPLGNTAGTRRAIGRLCRQPSSHSRHDRNALRRWLQRLFIEPELHNIDVDSLVSVLFPPQSRRERVVEASSLVRCLFQLHILPPEVCLRCECHAERQTRKDDLQNHRHGVTR